MSKCDLQYKHIITNFNNISITYHYKFKVLSKLSVEIVQESTIINNV